MPMTHDELKARVAEARARYEALPPVDRAIADCEQRLSGAHGMQSFDSTVTKAQIRAQMPEFVLIDEIVRLRAIEATARALHHVLYVDDAFLLEDGGSPEQIDALMKLRAALGLPA